MNSKILLSAAILALSAQTAHADMNSYSTAYLAKVRIWAEDATPEKQLQFSVEGEAAWHIFTSLKGYKTNRRGVLVANSVDGKIICSVDENKADRHLAYLCDFSLLK